MNRLLTALAAALVVLSTSVLVPQPATAGSGVKFFIVEWRRTWGGEEVRPGQGGASGKAEGRG